MTGFDPALRERVARERLAVASPDCGRTGNWHFRHRNRDTRGVNACA